MVLRHSYISPSLSVVTDIADKLFMSHEDSLSFSWNKICSWFTRLEWSIPHLWVTPMDPTPLPPLPVLFHKNKNYVVGDCMPSI